MGCASLDIVSNIWYSVFICMKKILLVDDEEKTATVFEAALKQGGYDVIVAKDGKSALEEVRKTTFDAVLLDQMMPDLSGSEVLKTLKQDPATKEIPVAMLTNFGHDEMIKEALNLGAQDYILKYQVAPADLISKMKRLIGE